MNPKTKAKIEVMAEKKYSYSVGSQEAMLQRDSDKVHYEMGATPWAEWCERFDKLCAYINGISDSDLSSWNKEDLLILLNGIEKSTDLLLGEYRTWLEGGGDE